MLRLDCSSLGEVELAAMILDCFPRHRLSPAEIIRKCAARVRLRRNAANSLTDVRYCVGSCLRALMRTAEQIAVGAEVGSRYPNPAYRDFPTPHPQPYLSSRRVGC